MLQLAIKRTMAMWERRMIWNCIDRRKIRCLIFANLPSTRRVTISVISCRWVIEPFERHPIIINIYPILKDIQLCVAN